jgi:uncharacterized membrane protein YeaQ/YmgE (transglycosylase-associated protein family)
MGVLAWVIMGLAIWHFTIFLPDRFWGGIVGAFLASVIGAVIVGFLLHGLGLPSQSQTHLKTAFEGIPGALLGIGVAYAEGVRRGNSALEL